MASTYPYQDRFEVVRNMPPRGRDRSAVLAELAEMASSEDKAWEGGQCSGTMYCGDHDHYGFMAEAYSRFAHVNALQRDMCPSVTRFEGEIIAMTLDLLGGSAITETEPAGMVTSGGSGSILHAVLAYREHARAERGITQPNLIKPETGHPAFDKACHLLGVELRIAPIDPDTTQVDLEAVRGLIDPNTVALVGSACNYGYGTIDPIEALSDLALEVGVGLHVDACLGGFILPWGQRLGLDIAPFDFGVPGVTSISADTHKYGYGFKGTSVLLVRDKALRNSQYFYVTEWSGGKYYSPGIEGSRSGGLLAATWAAMVSIGAEGYLDYARAIFDTAEKMRASVTGHPELSLMGQPWFCFSFTSEVFDIYHLNDHLISKGWRLNGQQYPNAVHMAVTRPQTQEGVAERFDADLAEAVEYATSQGDANPLSGAVYGGVAGGMTNEADSFIRTIMESMMDEQQMVPPLG